jgi:hypothetical protein
MTPRAKDEADIASEQEELARQEALRQAAGRYSPLTFRGQCHYCDEPCSGAFCDADCRKGWDHEQRVRAKQRGRAQTQVKEKIQ